MCYINAIILFRSINKNVFYRISCDNTNSFILDQRFSIISFSK